MSSFSGLPVNVEKETEVEVYTKNLYPYLPFFCVREKCVAFRFSSHTVASFHSPSVACQHEDVREEGKLGA